MMKDIDFTICPFIRDNMWFYDFPNFCKNSIVIKKLYMNLENNEKLMFKWYLYAHSRISLYLKDCIWKYLNGDISYKDLLLIKK